MSRLISVLGVILLAVGLVLGLLELMQPGSMMGRGISLGTSVDLIIGGILALGLGGVIGALRDAGGLGALAAPAAAAGTDDLVPGSSIGDTVVETAPGAAPDDAAPAVVEEAPIKSRFGFGKKLAASTTAAAGAAGAAVAATTEAVSSPVQETLDALEQAKQDIKGALGSVEAITEPEPAPAPVVEAAVEEEPEAAEDDELYVIEEKMIRGRPARILSDNTVEAETNEGWMRFENLEHLNEYLDAEGQ